MEDLKNEQSETRIDHETLKFEYSPENPPPLEVLESKVFAVHATAILPKNGVLKAGALDSSPDNKWEGDEPPSFRPTIHFSLGELVQNHGQWSWEENKPYVIISSLKNLEDQLINVFPHDTFVLGDLPLQEGMILLVPEGTDVSKIPQEVEIREYDTQSGSRQAVDSTISEKQGWRFQMKPEGVGIGSVAYIEDVEVNDPKFFKSLFEKHPHISFGDHMNSERGDAFRFGVIEQTINTVMKTYSDHWSILSTPEISFRRAMVVHNLQRLEQTIENTPVNQQARQSFAEKKEKLGGWLNIVDCDLETRSRLGKTFAGAPESIQETVRARRGNPAKLREFVNEIYLELPDAIQESKMSPAVLAETLSSMPIQELSQFVSDNEAVFAHTSLPEFYSHYTTRRWVLVKDEQAKIEGLDQLLVKSLEQLPTELEEKDGIFDGIAGFLDKESNRLETALTILRNPTVQEYLSKRFNIQFGINGPLNLQEVITAHPETRNLLESQELPLSDEQKEAYQLLNSLGEIYKPQTELQEALTSFSKAKSLAFEMKWLRNKLHQDYETISKPLNITRDLDDVELGANLTLYEILKRDEEPIGIWRKFGLEKEYKRMFKKDSDFWESDQSLMEVYKRLKAQKNN